MTSMPARCKAANTSTRSRTSMPYLACARAAAVKATLWAPCQVMPLPARSRRGRHDAPRTQCDRVFAGVGSGLRIEEVAGRHLVQAGDLPQCQAVDAAHAPLHVADRRARDAGVLGDVLLGEVQVLPRHFEPFAEFLGLRVADIRGVCFSVHWFS